LPLASGLGFKARANVFNARRNCRPPLQNVVLFPVVETDTQLGIVSSAWLDLSFEA